MNLVLEDRSRVGTVYFMMSEDNIRKEIGLPWVSFGSDAASMAPEPPFTRSSAHPRAYGNFARLLGRYVRDEKLIPLEDAVYRLSGLPATNLALAGRGILREGMFADVVVLIRADRRSRDIRSGRTSTRGNDRRLGQRCASAQGRRAYRGEARTGPLGRGRKWRPDNTQTRTMFHDVGAHAHRAWLLVFAAARSRHGRGRLSATGEHRCLAFPTSHGDEWASATWDD